MEKGQSARVLVLHGPNLNLLGLREPDIYASTTLADINAGLLELGRELGLEVEPFQSNHEGALVDRIQAAREQYGAIMINGGAYTHTSVAILDALLAVDLAQLLARHRVLSHHAAPRPRSAADAIVDGNAGECGS